MIKTNRKNGIYGKVFDNLEISTSKINSNTARFTIRPDKEKRWKVPFNHPKNLNNIL